MRNLQPVILKGIAFTFFCLTLLCHAGMAQAATFNVANGDVAGLIATINSANTSSAPNTINLAAGARGATAAVAVDLPGSSSLFNWVNVNTPGSVPSPRTGHRMVYDPVRRKVILFGGHDPAVHPSGNYVLTSHLNDIWELDTATNVWTDVTPTTGPMPVGRADFGMAYDVARNKVVIFGGEIDGWLAGDTWEWDPATRTWTEKPASTLVYGGLFGVAMAYDPNRHQVILFGGRAYYNWGQAGTYAWDGANWIDVTPAVYPPPRFIHAMATDLARSKVVMFGGKNNEYPLTDTWEWDGSAWTQVIPSGPIPLAREDPSMAYDAARQVTVLFGGYEHSDNDTWSWDGGAWSLEHPQNSPSTRSTAMVYDPSQSKLVLFSGDLQSDTWYSEITTPTPTPTPSPVPTCLRPPSGIIDWWRGDGNADDLIGGNNGTLLNGATFASGKFGQAFSFDGVNQGVLISSGALPDIPASGQFTVGLWLNPSNVNGVHTMFQHERSYLYIDNGVIRSFLGGNATDTGITAPVGQWTHAALTYNNGSVNVYVNGVLAASSAHALEDQSGFATSIGYDFRFNNEYFPGLIDEVEFFDRALSSAEISAISNACADMAPPTTTASLSSQPNGAGWNNTDVNVTLTATDANGGTGVKEITYSASGAQTIPATTVAGDTTLIPLSAEGQTTVTYFATDYAGNIESAQTLVLKIDKSAPLLSCAPADGIWHASDVSIGCTASDTISGLAVAADASFSLSTNVSAGTETSNASTNSRAVCDLAGNCATAGPIDGNKVDKKAPIITITSPATGSVYVLNQAVAASYACTDGGSGVASCIGPVASGSNIDTSSAGAKTFTVNATDNVGNLAPANSVNYTVTYGLNVLFDQTRAAKSGSTIPIKIQLVDAFGRNVSSAALVVHAVSLIQIATAASETINDAGSANPDTNFRFDSSLGASGGYIFNLKTKGLSTGTYRLGFTVNTDPAIYTVQFAVRQ